MKVAYLFVTFPVLSQTFLQREIRGIAAAGIEVDVHSMWTADNAAPWETTPGITLHQWSRADLILRSPQAALEALCRPALLRQGIARLNDFSLRSREDLANAALGTLFAFRHAAEFRKAGYDLIHGAWATGPATAALLLGRLCGVPFSFGAHAFDIHRNGGDLFLPYKLEKAALVHTTTEMNFLHLSRLAPRAAAKIVLSRRGLAELPPFEPARPIHSPLRILSVGRLIPKKGQNRQIDAVALLKEEGIAARLRIVGDGPLREELSRQIAARGLQQEIELTGALSPAAVREEYRWADLFWHSGIVGADGDRDGLPNVLPEAMAHGVPVVSSDAAGTTEAVKDYVTGLIAPGGTAEMLTDCVCRLVEDEGLRERLRRQANAWVAENFRVEKNTALLAAAFRKAAENPAQG